MAGERREDEKGRPSANLVDVIQSNKEARLLQSDDQNEENARW